MRKVLPILAALIFLFTDIAFANRIGAQAGLSFSSSTSPSSASRGTFFSGGVLYAHEVGPWAIQPEMNFLGVDSSYAFLSFPILFKGTLDFGSSVSPFMFAGPDLRFRIMTPKDYAGGQRAFDLAIVAGIGAEQRLDSVYSLFFDLRYGVGLINQLDAPAGPETFRFKGLQLLAGAVMML